MAVCVIQADPVACFQNDWATDRSCASQILCWLLLCFGKGPLSLYLLPETPWNLMKSVIVLKHCDLLPKELLLYNP